MKARLTARIQSVAELTEADRSQMFDLFETYYDDVVRDRFDEDLACKHDVIVLRDTQRRVRGFSTLQRLEVRHEGRMHRAVFSGDTVVDEAFWGTRVLGRAFLGYMFRQRMRHPFSRLWWFLISKGYKTYLLMANNFPEHWPRYERPTPHSRRALLDALAAQAFSSFYDATSGLIRFPPHHGRLRHGVAATTEALLADNPRARFFAQRNPEWATGVELACIASMSWSMPLRYAAKAAWKRVRRQLRALPPRSIA